MLRLIPKIIALILALAFVVVGGISVALRRLVNTEEFRGALHESAAEALGTPIEWSALGAAVVPLRLTILDPVLIAEATNRDQARLNAEKVDLRLSAMALLQNTLKVDSLVLSGVELIVTRTPEGLILPTSGRPEQGEAIDLDSLPRPDLPQGTPDVEEDALQLALRRFVIEDSRIVVRDETLSRVVEWQFEGVRVVATRDSLDQPLALELITSVAANGRAAGDIAVLGDVNLAALYDLDVAVEAFQLAELQPYIQDATIAGALSGTIRMEGAEGVLSKLEADLEVAQMVVKSFGLDLVGRFDLKANQTLNQPAGTNVAGRLTADADLAMNAERVIERVSVKLAVTEARVVGAPLDVSGRLDLDIGRVGNKPIQLTADLKLDDGSALTVTGTSTETGVVDMKASLETFDLAIARPFLPNPQMKLAGLASGTGRLVGDAAAPEFLSFEADVEAGAFVTEDYSVEGPFLAVIKIKEPWSRPRGGIDLDLTGASLLYRDQFSKPAGIQAEMTTRFFPEESGEIVFESKLKLRDIDETLLGGSPR